MARAMRGGRGALIAATIFLCSCSVRVQCDAASSSASPEQEQEIHRLRSKVASLEEEVSWTKEETSQLEDVVREKTAQIAASSSVSPEQEQEIQRLRSKVASLEDEVSWTKEETSQLEDVVREKMAQIAELVGGLEALQVRNAGDDEPVVKSSTSNPLLEKQIERLGNDLEDQVKKGELLEALASESERRLLQLGKKLERVEKVNVEQRKKIEELQHDLQHSEEKLSEVERRAKLAVEELAMVRGMWLPYWFASRSVHCQDLASAKWHLHGKPVLDALTHKLMSSGIMDKVAATLAHGQRLVEPHLQLQAIQNKLVPVAKAHFNSLKNRVQPYVSPVANRSARAYRVCSDAIQPCMAKSQSLADQYWQKSKKLSEPYVARIAAASEPHLSKANMVLEPYTRPVASVWSRLLTATSMYHRQVQKGITRFLEGNELLKLNPVSAHRLASWTASALFSLPIFAIYKVFSVTSRSAVRKFRRDPTEAGADHE